MIALHVDILCKRDGKWTLCVQDDLGDHFETEEIGSTARTCVIAAIQKIVRRIGRPDIIHTDHGRVWSGLPAAFGAAHRICSPSAQSRLSLLERRFQAELRA
jgi:hypothetical protein